jgi:predicted nuclease with TOPRIM domain
MASDYDATEFVDGDFEAHKTSQPSASAGAGQSQRAPSREEIGSRVAETQQQLAEILREKEELERKRAALEETRRRQTEVQTGRNEMVHNLTRGLGLLEEAEFNARRDVEQMAKTLRDLREALVKVETIQEETWTASNLELELTRALTILENARMEWNSARLKLPVLSGSTAAGAEAAVSQNPNVRSDLAGQSFGQLCRLGLALTWPVAVVTVLVGVALLLVLLRH